MEVGAALTVANKIVAKAMALWRENMVILLDGRGEEARKQGRQVSLYYILWG